ncbi:hypothetical protein [Pedococcus soli]
MRRTAGLRLFAAPVAVTVGLAAWVCARSLGQGWYLYRDFVAVPDPRFGPQTLGTSGAAARAVPLDAVTTALAVVVPTAVQQQVMLVATLVLAGLGVTVLLRHHGPAAMTCGAAVAVWNPYVAERLLVGQPPTLLAYAAVPWVVVAVRHPTSAPRRLLLVVLAALPAALTPFGGLLAAVVALVASLLTPGRRTRGWIVAVALAALAWCLPWLLAALLGPPVVADRDGAAAFAVGADSPLGTIGSVLMLGGIWAPGARPGSRLDLLPVAASIGVLLVAAVGVALLVRGRQHRAAVVVGASYVLPVTAVLLLSSGPGLALFARAQDVPGVAILRDTHRLLALSTVALAVAVGVAVGAATSALGRRLGGAGSAQGVGVVLGALALTVLTVPDLPGAVTRSYRPVAYPDSWHQVVDAVDRAPAGAVLVLPWQPFRDPAWAGGRPFLDPVPRALDREVLSSFDLTVVRDGHPVTVDGGDPAEGASWAAGRLDPGVLDRLGVTVVVEWRGTVGRLPQQHTGLHPVLTTPEFTVWARTTAG